MLYHWVSIPHLTCHSLSLINRAIIAIIFPALVWVVVFLISTLVHGIVSLMDAAASTALKYTAQLLFGWDLRVKHLSFRPNLGHLLLNVDGYSEVVLHGLELKNPPGAYLHENMLECDSIRIRFDILDVIGALRLKGKKFYAFPKIPLQFLGQCLEIVHVGTRSCT